MSIDEQDQGLFEKRTSYNCAMFQYLQQQYFDVQNEVHDIL
jgi:hypothetical protein